MTRKEMVESLLSWLRFPTGACLIWSGSTTTGYGTKTVRDADGCRRNVYPHRDAYQLLHGPMPTDAVVHHLCENKACFNPAHLALTTRSEHPRIHAGDYCRHGHRRVGECRECCRRRTREWRSRNRDKVAAYNRAYWAARKAVAQ